MTTRADLPLVFDMDGVWVTSDVSLEMLLHYVRAHPLRGSFYVLRWAWQGKATLKHNLHTAMDGALDIALLPVNDRLRNTEAYQTASQRVLVSGSHGTIVQQVAGLSEDFEWSGGSCHERNLVGEEKAKLLRSLYPQGFAYVGDSVDDVPVWKAAKRAYAVQPSRRALRLARDNDIDLEVLESRPSQLSAFIETMRLHQWSKNALVFMMLLLNLDWVQPGWILALLATFIAFGLVASATYVFNDLLDLQADRSHAQKRNRPLASGRLKLKNALLGMVLLLVAGFALAAATDTEFLAMLVGYAAISVLYSTRLKRVPILDALILSLLFCWRVIAGSVVINVELVPWFTASLALFFFSLALGKRAIELQLRASRTSGQKDLSGRGYRVEDYAVVMALGVASGLGSAIVTMIYALFAGQSIISEPVLAFAACSLLAYWLGYVWLTINRGEMHHDPTIFALKDRTSLCVLVAMGAVIAAGQIL
ncbi:MAG: UbiA family prenyltransferase [Ahrensia sp.]|nr:UbiA family prenyltransferase [Ahrensia sp.]